jgi:hypothetical protein
MGVLCATVFYRKRIEGRLYPKAARTSPYAFAEEVRRVDGKVVSRYVGIVQVPERANVIEMEEGSRDHSPTNPNRSSRNYSEFRVGQTDSETALLRHSRKAWRSTTSPHSSAPITV